MSMSGITNRETRAKFAEFVLNQFKDYITGIGKDNELFQTSLKSLADSNEIKSTENDKLKNTTNFNYVSKLLDTANGAYFMKDIVDGTAFQVDPISKFANWAASIAGETSDSMEKISKSLLFHYEGSGGTLGDTIVSDIKVSDVTTLPSVGDTVVKKKEDKKNDSGEQQTYSIASADPNQTDPTLVNKNPTSPSKSEPSLGSIVFRDSILSIASRNGDALSLFFNGIPPIEMSRCAPFIDLKIFYGDRTKSLGTMNNVSYMRFIRRGENNEFVLDDAAGIASSKPVDIIGEEKIKDNENKYYTGMDIFTSPATLSNANVRNSFVSIDDSSIRGGNVLEPIAPFLTLESLSVSISGLGQGLFASKRASLSLILHDRSRLSDVAPLVSTESFGKIQMLIEYGWSHPDGGINSNNPVGQFLDSLRDVGVFNVVSSSFSFGSDNTVKITVDLAALGGKESVSVPAATGNIVPIKLFKGRLEESLEQRIGKDYNDLPDDADLGALSEVRPFLDVIDEARGDAVVSIATMQNFLETLESSIDGQIGDDDFISILESIGTQLDSATQKDLLVKAFSSKFSKLETITGLNDPYLGDTQLIDATPEENSVVISLGAVFDLFIGYSLAASGRFDEVQMMYYPINHQAAGARIHTTASMPIDIDKLKQVLFEKESTKTLTIASFLGVIEREIIKDNSLTIYGMSESAELQKEIVSKTLDSYNEEAERQLEEEKIALTQENIQTRAQKIRQAELNTANSAFTEQLKRVYQETAGPPSKLQFIPPNLSMFIETLPVINQNSTTENVDQVICRVHIYDEEAILSPTEKILQDLITSKDLNIYINSPGPFDSDDERQANLLGGDYVVDKLNSDNTVIKRRKATNRQIKEKIKNVYPSITYGSSTGTVKSLSVSSNTSGGVANVLLLNSIKQTATANANGNEIEDYKDVKLIPSSVNLTCEGIPLLQRANNVYVDFNSGTTLDNVYTCVSVTHNISAGKFETSATLSYTGQGAIEPFRDKITAVKEYITNNPNPNPNITSN